MTTSDPSSGPDDYEQDPAARFAEIVEYGSAIVFQFANRWYDRAKHQQQWVAEDVVGDCTDLVEHITPLIERTLDLAIEALRPYAQAASSPPSSGTT
jgi:hypothetical protein